MSELAVGPLVQVVIAGETTEFPFSAIAQEDDDPATISDRDLIARCARWMDRDEAQFDDFIVSRPATSNLLVSRKPVYGS